MTMIATSRNDKTTPFGKYGKLYVEGANLCDSNGNQCQLQGLSSHNVNSFPQYLNEATITELTDRFNLDIFRFAMYCGDADGDHGYATGDDAFRLNLENKLMEVVQITAKLGIYLMIDWHVLLEKYPGVYAKEAEAFFRKICPMLTEYDNIIYEICNEPNEDCTWEQIYEYADHLIPLIQSIDNTKVIIVGTPVWSQRVDEAAAKPLHYDNLMYTLHFYADTHRQGLRDLAIDAIENHNLPIFISEFGICDCSGNGPVNKEETEAWLELINKYNLSYILWNLSNKNETSAILKPTCDKLSNFTDDDFSECGKVFKELLKF